PIRIAPDLHNAYDPIWSPDSKRLIVSGAKNRIFDWWIVPLRGGPSRAVEMMQVFRRFGFPTSAITRPGRETSAALWIQDRWIVFSGGTGDTASLYRIRLSSSDMVTGDPERITFGTSIETKPTVSAGGQLVLASQVFIAHLWSLPMDSN